jgi:hypothetical protein
VDEIRSIVRSDGAPRKKVDSLYKFVVQEQALEIPEQAKPLDPIRIEDIQLVCWMAVSPSN